ncbi:MAG: S8 family serine peptidase [Longimicrobiaceae bacterium]
MNRSASRVFEQNATMAWARRAGLATLRRTTEGSPDFLIALLDGRVDARHECFSGALLTTASEDGRHARSEAGASHATFAASMLVGRGNSALGLCPACALLSVPVADAHLLSVGFPVCEAASRIAAAVSRSVAYGARVIQIGLEFSRAAPGEWAPAAQAIEAAAAAGVRTVMAAGNDGTLAPGPLVRCAGVVPVVGADRRGVPHPSATLAPSIGLRGLTAPGVDIPGARLPSGSRLRSGSSFAASFVTASIALLHAVLPRHPTDEIWAALLSPARVGSSIVPKRVDADRVFHLLS